MSMPPSVVPDIWSISCCDVPASTDRNRLPGTFMVHCGSFILDFATWVNHHL